MRDLALIYAPSNLGLRPLYAGHEPGTWRAPEALAAAGLAAAVAQAEVVQLHRPRYSSKEQSKTRLLNGNTIRAFNLALADTVEDATTRGLWPLVVGGDCSVMLGALAGLRRTGPLSLVHVDGHSDFRHPGNYDNAAGLGAVAGMDLALATGRGEALMTQWPAVSGALVPDAQVVQIGERENRNVEFAWPDINTTVQGIVRSGKAYAYLMNIVPQGSTVRAKKVLKALEDAGHPTCPVIIGQKVEVRDAIAKGLGINEASGKGAASKDFAELFAWLNEQVRTV